MGTGFNWLPIIAAISSRWWYPWTLYASQHSSNGKSASQLLKVGIRLARTPDPDVVYNRPIHSRVLRVFEVRTSSAQQTVEPNELTRKPVHRRSMAGTS